MTANATGKGKLLEKGLEPIFVQAFVGVDIRVAAFEIHGTQHARRAVAGTRQEDGVQIMLPDGPVHMRVDE